MRKCLQKKNSDEEEENEPVLEEENKQVLEISKGRPRKGRKRRFPGQDRKTRKILRNSNQEYYTAKGKLTKPKEFVEYKCTCSSKCNEKLSIEDQRKFFNHFWNLADYNVQTTYLSTCVREQPVQRKIVSARDPNKRQYFVNKVAVCRDLFINILRISTKRINTALQKKNPKKDTCNKCDAFSTKMESLPEGDEKVRIENEKNLHLEQAETARKKMNLDLSKADTDDKTETLTFDMEKTPPLPQLTTNIIFYKRQLWLFNCGIYSGKQKNPLLMFGSKGKRAVELKNFLPNDSDFGDVECRQNKVCCPQDYINIMKTCRKKRPIDVHKIKKDDFVSTRALEKVIVNRKKSCECEKAPYKRNRWLSQN
ncbi:unnamed protein product [Brassicogethes aeneus]|uniref:Uncharacterized protein n=1 Tax=Brassicogethes aeneus TaxID=1431903 RepID=A0A9P0BDN3_BRAAE|nr:unnamed protein product [Brassicogethes aeneus]